MRRSRAGTAHASPDDAAMTNLDHWHAFETENPDAFFLTYQFWVRC